MGPGSTSSRFYDPSQNKFFGPPPRHIFKTIFKNMVVFQFFIYLFINCIYTVYTYFLNDILLRGELILGLGVGVRK